MVQCSFIQYWALNCTVERDQKIALTGKCDKDESQRGERDGRPLIGQEKLFIKTPLPLYCTYFTNSS